MIFLITARAIHFASCLLIFGICAFDTITCRQSDRVARGIILICLPIAILSGAAWLITVTVAMSGRSFNWDDLRLVWNQTQFGTVWKWRLLFWLLTSVTIFLLKKWPALICSGLFVGSLAWSGHGQTGKWPDFHLTADVLHLLAVGFWPVGLLPFAIVLRSSPPSIAEITRRFSISSMISVALVGITGLINSYCLLDQPTDLVSTTYGRVLLLKIILFCLAVGIGAVNLLYIRPRLDTSAAQLRRNVWMEVIFSTAIILLVALLGTLPPALGR